MRPEKPTEVFRWVVTVVVLVLLAWGLSADIKWSRLLEAPGEFATIVRLMFRDPDWSALPGLLSAMWESIAMAWLGTVIATIFAIPLAFLAAENLVPGWVAFLTRQVFNVLRAVPEIILAVVFIPIFGLGPQAGIMALGVGSIGTLGKLCYEIIEGLDDGPIEAADATGATGVQRLRWAVVPQVLPELASFAMYRFEVNIRASAVLGVVGAGGIGGLLAQYIQFKVWERAGLALVVVVLATILVDAISGRIRRRIIAGPDGTGDVDGDGLPDDLDPDERARLTTDPVGGGAGLS
ncbi:phosphonate ABC transporter, permease protein PhnE [Nitriliruptoria bacterium AS10]|nr:phosphonate ABC transporter, permease protein PhnE [Salsipaludibacter albus]MBY5163078.1 phosphonate ABC transporter, permease protein PhnE [Salsipaludibacter albus]